MLCEQQGSVALRMGNGPSWGWKASFFTVGDPGLISSKVVMITNYRPISILPAVTKITEKLVHSPMMSCPTLCTLKLHRITIEIFGPWWNSNGPRNMTGSFFYTQINSHISGPVVMKSKALQIFFFLVLLFPWFLTVYCSNEMLVNVLKLWD